MKEKFELVTIFNKPVLFTCERLNRKEIPDNLFCYDIRHDDECRGDMVQLKDYVTVDHWGTVICKEPFDIKQKLGDRVFTTAEGIDMDENDYNYLGEIMSVDEYCDRYAELIREYCEEQQDESVNMEM